MEKIKMNAGTMVALVLVAAAVSALLINFGMVQAGGNGPDKVKAEFELEFEQEGDDVDFEVKGKFNTAAIAYTARAYSATDCEKGTLIGGSAIGTDSDGGNIDIEGTLSGVMVSQVNSVSIRQDSGGPPGDLVQCFLNTTPEV